MAINPPNPPSVTFPSPHEFPETIQKISGIANGSRTVVNVIDHGFTSQDVNITTVMFLQVKGMRQINGVPGLIIQVIDENYFTVNIDSTFFYPYVSGGVISTVTGHPPIEQFSFQYFNTPFQNIL